MRLLIVGGLQGQIGLATKIAMDRGAKVTHAADIEQALATLRGGIGADLVFCDVALDIAALVRGLSAERICTPVVACGIGTDTSRAVAAIRAGAKEYLPLPADAELIAAVIAAVADESHHLVYEDEAMGAVLALADQMSRNTSTPHTLRTEIAYRMAATRPDEAIKIVEGMTGRSFLKHQAEAFGWLAVAVAPRDKKRAIALIDRALAMPLDQPQEFASYTYFGGATASAAWIADCARRAGYPDMESWIRWGDNSGQKMSGNRSQNYIWPQAPAGGGVAPSGNSLMGVVKDRGASILKKLAPAAEAAPSAADAAGDAVAREVTLAPGETLVVHAPKS